MIMNETTVATPTSGFVGKCTACVYPVKIVDESSRYGDYLSYPCPGCGASLRLERLYGTFTRDTCDPSCMGAIGPICQCACGGANHGGRYNIIRGQISAGDLAHYREQVAKREAARRKAAETRARKAAAERAAALAAWAEDHADVINFLGDGSQFDPNGRYDAFLWDMASNLANGRTLTPNMVAAVRRSMAVRAKIAAARAADDATARPCPTGTQTITGKIVKAWDEDVVVRPGVCRTVYKMTVKCDGYMVRMTIPSALIREADHTLDNLRGARVRITCEIERGKRSDSYGFGSRPRKAELLPA